MVTIYTPYIHRPLNIIDSIWQSGLHTYIYPLKAIDSVRLWLVSQYYMPYSPP